MTLALALIAVVVVAVYILWPQFVNRVFGYGDDRDPRWTRKLAEKRDKSRTAQPKDGKCRKGLHRWDKARGTCERCGEQRALGRPLSGKNWLMLNPRADKRLDALPPLDGDPLDEGWGRL